MEYANAGWIHEMGSRPHESALTSHDPIITDTNLAEIDFEDFRNEDLAYAFSCGVSIRFLNVYPFCIKNFNSLKRSVYKIQSLFFAGRGIWV